MSIDQDYINIRKSLPLGGYSAEYQDLISHKELNPYSHTMTDPMSVQHTIGLKGYELTNHLGNVQAVVTDKKRGADLNSDDTIDRYRPGLMAAYDYYPFGMLMPGRYTSDTAQRCAWITQMRWVPRWAFLDLWPEWDCGNCGFEPVADAEVHTEPGPNGILRIEANGSNSGAVGTLSLPPDAEHSFRVIVRQNTGLFNLYVEKQIGEGTEEWEAVAVKAIEGTEPVTFNVAAEGSPTLRFRIIKASGGAAMVEVEHFSLWMLTKVQENVLVQVCDKAQDRYRFGFNGMEKDNEIKGLSNSINYKERFEDTRLGRFFSVDPLASKYPYLTPYQFAGNNPIKFIDRDGLEPAENPATLQQRNPTDFPHGRMFLTTATDIQTQKPKDFWVFQRELPKMQGHEYSYHTGTGGASGWSVFWNDAANSASRATAAKQFYRATQIGFTTALTLPFGGAGTSIGLTGRALSAAYDATGQYLTNGRNVGKINISSIGASFLQGNPIASETIGQGFNYSIDDKFNYSYVFGDMSEGELAGNVGIATGVGLTFKALDNAIGTSGGQQSSFGAKRDLMTLGKKNARRVIGTGNAASGVGQSATTNAIQSAVSKENQ